MILSIPLLTTQEADNPSDHLKPEKSSTTHRCTRARVPPLQLSHLHLSLLFFTGQYLTEFLLINVHIDQFYRFEQTVTGYVLRQFGQELCQENELLMDKNFLIKLQDSCKVNQKISIIYGFQVLQKQIQVQYSSIKKDNSPFDK